MMYISSGHVHVSMFGFGLLSRMCTCHSHVGKRISMNDVDIQEGTACRSVDVVVGYSSCAKYLKDTAASLPVPPFGMSTIFTF